MDIHLDLIAETLRASRPVVALDQNTKVDFWQAIQWMSTVHQFASALLDADNLFDMASFYEDCGLDEDYRNELAMYASVPSPKRIRSPLRAYIMSKEAEL